MIVYIHYLPQLAESTTHIEIINNKVTIFPFYNKFAKMPSNFSIFIYVFICSHPISRSHIKFRDFPIH